MDGERKADVVAEVLLRRIARGEVAVGSLLPVEAELADEFDVNRSVVREAVKLLEVHRLVRPIRRRGTEVLDPIQSLSPEVLQALLSPRPGHVDLEFLRSLLEVRALIDVEMNSLAAVRRSESDLERLRLAIEHVMAARESPRVFARRMDEVAMAIALAAQSPVFVMLAHWHRRVYAELEDLFETVRLPSSPWVDGLGLLLTSFRDRDGEAARRLVSAYHAWASPRLLAAAALRNGAPLDELAPRAPE
ncbi:MAG: FadR family transcriptional regulator [Deltaproteobacteria bacterium]|nr:FadR family transcriptional regulator [Deltaproteobacteria bacterium]